MEETRLNGLRQLLAFILGLDVASMVYTYFLGQALDVQLSFLGSGMFFGYYAPANFWLGVQSAILTAGLIGYIATYTVMEE